MRYSKGAYERIGDDKIKSIENIVTIKHLADIWWNSIRFTNLLDDEVLLYKDSTHYNYNCEDRTWSDLEPGDYLFLRVESYADFDSDGYPIVRSELSGEVPEGLSAVCYLELENYKLVYKYKNNFYVLELNKKKNGVKVFHITFGTEDSWCTIKNNEIKAFCKDSISQCKMLIKQVGVLVPNQDEDFYQQLIEYLENHLCKHKVCLTVEEGAALDNITSMNQTDCWFYVNEKGQTIDLEGKGRKSTSVMLDELKDSILEEDFKQLSKKDQNALTDLYIRIGSPLEF